METKTALIGSDRAVELYAETVVDLDLALVIYPGNSEQDRALRCGNALQKGFLPVLVLICLDDDTKALKDLFNGLMKFGLRGVLCYDSFQYFINV